MACMPLRPLHADDAAADSRLQATRLQSLRLGLPAGTHSHAGVRWVTKEHSFDSVTLTMKYLLLKFSKLL